MTESTPIPLLVAALLTLASGCSGPKETGPYAGAPAAERRPEEAAHKTLEAAEWMGEDDDRAETLLREALSADLYHGPAHNNLGVLHLRRDELYEAANEFEWARKLMPGHPDPRLNLGLALERAGRLEGALESYNAALEVYSEHIPTLQAIARLRLLRGERDEVLLGQLDEIALRGETPEWRDWAREQRLRLER